MDGTMEKKRIVTFYGCDTQTGTTMVSLSAAEVLAEEGLRTLYISAGVHPGITYAFMEKAGCLADLYGSYLDGKMAETELAQMVTEHRGVDILPGIRSWQSGRHAMTGLLQETCRLALRRWEYVVIDGGSCWEVGMGGEAVQAAGQLFLVITQQEKALERWSLRKGWFQSLEPENRCFLVNKFNSSGAFYTENQMRRLLECTEKDLLTVPYVPFGWQAEADRATLLRYTKFRKGIRKVAEYIRKKGELADNEKG